MKDYFLTFPGIKGDELKNFENVDLKGSLDTIVTGDNQNNIISTGSGNDKLFGGEGNDSLHGGNGDDLLYGDNGGQDFSSPLDDGKSSETGKLSATKRAFAFIQEDGSVVAWGLQIMGEIIPVLSISWALG